jgi:hypothetical protein
MAEDQIARPEIDAVWLSICRRLEENVVRINSELKKDHVYLDIGNIIGIVKVREYGSGDVVGFELAMNTGGLQVWFQENLIRHDLYVESFTDKATKTRVYLLEGETLAIEELVDRVFKRWLEKKWKLIR